MSDVEEENFCFYGKPLDPYDEEAFPKKRPITVEEQIATDAQGRRRFHGAFTGGFSAGFFNTVGSLEGWTPSEFKSSRSEKQKHVTQNAADFMDDEDMGEFGFAPQSIRATKDYDTSKKRKRKVFSDGPIPGEPVLHSLLTAGNETVGYLLLKNIGMKDKIKARYEECSSSNKVYGCEMPNTSSISETIVTKDYELPEFYNQFLLNPKNDTFSLGYVGLDKSHVNLFRSTDLVVQEKNKKLSIRGQAFGVGAFENDDDDIYAKEDMSNYDFELVKEKERPRKVLNNSIDKIFDTFIKTKVNTLKREIYPPPVIPKSFTGKHKVKKSRFEPLQTLNAEEIDRRKIDSTQRAILLGEETNINFTPSKNINSKQNPVTDSLKQVKIEKDSSENSATTSQKPTSKSFDPSSLWDDRFVSGAQDDTNDILTPVKRYESDHYSKDMKDAAKLKMYGALTRISEDWQPCALLCKRFNVPEPFSDKPRKSQDRLKMKNLIFEYQKHHEENIALKSGLTQFTSEPSEVVTIDDNPSGNNSIIEVKQETEEVEAITDPGFVEIKNEAAELENEKEKISDVEKDEIKLIDITDRLHIEEKEDLFKAVFLSSSESEDEREEVEDNEEKNEIREDTRELELKSNILGEDVQIPKIKPIKEGILSGLNFKSFHPFTKPVIEKNNEGTNDSNENETNSYGPKLPEKTQFHDVVVPGNDNKISSNRYSDSSSDEWVEKIDIKKLKKRKQKKSKSSHKKKHKHKKKKH